MLANIWGPSLWTYLHLLSISYPDKPTDDDKEEFKNFIKYIGLTLPCDICKNHYFSFMTEKRVEIGIKNKQNFMELFWQLHNNVNKLNDKEQVDFNSFLEKYDKIIKYDENKHFNIFKYKKEVKYFKQLSLVLSIMLVSIVILKCYHIFIQKY
jgi:hypothetical protein